MKTKPGISPKAPASAPLPPVDLNEISKRLVNGADFIKAEWEKYVTSGKPNQENPMVQKGILRWLALMAEYYHQGGTGCALAPLGEKCNPRWNPVPLCWDCAGGEGLPPRPGETETPLAERWWGELGIEHQPMMAPYFLASTLMYQPEGPITVIRISEIGECRRKVAYKHFEEEPSDLKPEHWGNAAYLGSAGEQLMVGRLVNQDKRTVENTGDNQKTVSFGFGPIMFLGHPDGDILRPIDDGEGNPWRNLEIKVLNTDRANALLDQPLLYVAPMYYSQVQGYMHAKRQDETELWVMDRNSGKRMMPQPGQPTQIVAYDPGVIWSLILKWLDVAENFQEQALPEPDYNGLAFNCVVCEWRSKCPAWQATHKQTAKAA